MKLEEQNANHIAVLNSEMGFVQKELEKHTKILELHSGLLAQNGLDHMEIKTTLTWQNKLLMLILGAVVTGIFGLFISRIFGWI